MTFREFMASSVSKHGLVITQERVDAIDYLERKGRRFLVDFGVDTAVATARELKRQNRSNAQLRRSSGER